MQSNVLGETKQEFSAPTAQKRIHMVQQLPNVPKPLEVKDWRKTAQAYDRFVFDFNQKGKYMPVIWKDKTHYNMDEDTFGLMSYVGKFAQGGDGSQEAINVMGAVLGATLAGIDKSDQDGNNYVKMLQTFYNRDQKVFVWYPNVPSGDSFWYEIQPHVLYYALAYFYPEEPEMEEIMRITADRWVEALEVLTDKEGRLDFRYTSFDFTKMEPVDNGKWREPDAAAGIAMLLYMAYSRFGNPEFLKKAVWCMEFLERQQDNPYYELLMYYAPYLAARMSVEQGKEYEIGKFINWIFDGGTVIREGWGTVTERWGSYDMHGLVGSLKDDGGYVFAMNGFHLFSALAPVVRYDPRYARDIGKWMLNLANQSRYFYADGLPPENQSCADWDGDRDHVIPYEGIRKEYEGKTPYASGDPTIKGWGALDFSLYSGSYVGFLGGLIDKTNVDGILKVDCLKSDYFHQKAYPTFLYYNPFGSEESVIITDLGNDLVDLYDTVSRQFVAKGVTDKASLELANNQAAVIVIVPHDGKQEWRHGQLWIEGVFIAPAPKPVVNICGLQDRQKVSGILKLMIETSIPAGVFIERITVTLGKTELFSGRELPETLLVDTDEFHNGLLHLRADLETSNGGKDVSEIGLMLENPSSPLSDPN
jgi:hypothetical protein